MTPAWWWAGGWTGGQTLGILARQAVRFGFEYRLPPLDGPLTLVLFLSSQMGIKRVFYLPPQPHPKGREALHARQSS